MLSLYVEVTVINLYGEIFETKKVLYLMDSKVIN